MIEALCLGCVALSVVRNGLQANADWWVVTAPWKYGIVSLSCCGLNCAVDLFFLYVREHIVTFVLVRVNFSDVALLVSPSCIVSTYYLPLLIVIHLD